jgi:toxin FitB
MILVDTNVFSAMMRLGSEPKVRHWLDHVDAAQLRVSAISLFEIQHGLARLADGRRRNAISSNFLDVLTRVFDDHVVPFDELAALAAGKVYAEHRSKGRNVDVPDCQIGGTAIAIDAAIATCNTTDFEGLGIELINPWAQS